MAGPKIVPEVGVSTLRAPTFQSGVGATLLLHLPGSSYIDIALLAYDIGVSSISTIFLLRANVLLILELGRCS